MGVEMIILIWLAGAMVGFPLWMLAEKAGMDSTTAAFVAGSVGQLLSMAIIGALTRDHQ